MKLSQDSRCSGRDSNRSPLEYKSRALTVDLSVWSSNVESKSMSQNVIRRSYGEYRTSSVWC
jgi:hypothetical protein